MHKKLNLDPRILMVKEPQEPLKLNLHFSGEEVIMTVYDLPKSTFKVIKWNYDWVIIPLNYCRILDSKGYHIENIIQYKTLLPIQNVSPAKCWRAIIRSQRKSTNFILHQSLACQPHVRHWIIEIKCFQSGLCTILKIIEILMDFK